MAKLPGYIILFFLSLFFIGGMFNSTFQYLGGFPLLFISIYFCFSRFKKVLTKRIVIYFSLLLIISLTFFLGFSKIINYHDFIKEAQKYWGSFSLFFTGYILIRTKVISIKEIKMFFLTGITLTSFYGIIKMSIDSIQNNKLERLTTPLGISNNYASILIIGVLILFYNLINKKYLINKRSDYVAFTILSASLLLTRSAGAIIGTAVAIFIYYFFRNRKLNLITGLTFVLIIFLLFSLSFSLFKKNILDHSNRQRIGLINGYTILIKKNPITGVGLNQTEYHYKSWKVPIPYQNQFGYVDKMDAHNFIIQWIAENGFPSFALLLLFLIYYFSNNFRKYNHSYGLLLGFLAYLIHALFSNNFHIIRLMMYFWLLLGVFDGLQYKTKRRSFEK
ncbi:MAG: O-antigen ligase family protein [Candidatus Mcinerneyibacterium aminivorans]|uniref:O-antigen ligase family protein n=1 Tax=Candidatus Mcinerneyibacterium aminivorans TaxID=2703815 RepID=A0A5D0MIY8_9BACT|nr:MAG: O-antigen ligase family protein [Candidatus Mcinerneyibacterium aminivorans]